MRKQKEKSLGSTPTEHLAPGHLDGVDINNSIATCHRNHEMVATMECIHTNYPKPQLLPAVMQLKI